MCDSKEFIQQGIDEVIQLLKEKRYKEAREAFKRLVDEHERTGALP